MLYLRVHRFGLRVARCRADIYGAYYVLSKRLPGRSHGKGCFTTRAEDNPGEYARLGLWSADLDAPDVRGSRAPLGGFHRSVTFPWFRGFLDGHKIVSPRAT